MLVNTDVGDTFTFAEMSAWLRDAGFIDVRQFDAPGPSPLILATRPDGPSPHPRGPADDAK